MPGKSCSKERTKPQSMERNQTDQMCSHRPRKLSIDKWSCCKLEISLRIGGSCNIFKGFARVVYVGNEESDCQQLRLFLPEGPRSDSQCRNGEQWHCIVLAATYESSALPQREGSRIPAACTASHITISSSILAHSHACPHWDICQLCVGG